MIAEILPTVPANTNAGFFFVVVLFLELFICSALCNVHGLVFSRWLHGYSHVMFCSAERAARCSYRHWEPEGTTALWATLLVHLLPGIWGMGRVGGKSWDLPPDKLGQSSRGVSRPLRTCCPPAAQALHGSTVLKLPLVTSVSTDGIDFAGLGLSTECTISISPPERVALPSLSCALGWWRAFPHAETSSQLQPCEMLPKSPLCCVLQVFHRSYFTISRMVFGGEKIVFKILFMVHPRQKGEKTCQTLVLALLAPPSSSCGDHLLLIHVRRNLPACFGQQNWWRWD